MMAKQEFCHSSFFRRGSLALLGAALGAFRLEPQTQEDVADFYYTGVFAARENGP
jgi:hypothetical protein